MSSVSGICFATPLLLFACRDMEYLRPLQIKPRAVEISMSEKKHLKGFVVNIEKETLENVMYRKVLYTAKNSQLVLMSIAPLDDVGEEVHTLDQFIRIEAGNGKAIINRKEHTISDGSAIVIPAGARHNIVNTSKTEALKLYTIYSPPEHKDGVVQRTKSDAVANEEHFDGVPSE